MKQVMKCFAY